MRLSDAQRLAEALRRAGSTPRLILLPDGTIVAEPADVSASVAAVKSDWAGV